ncbi:beta-1,3-galactosyltransferase brn-like [Mizuhopecten yessoensis]|uniref:beta-1,3-galactosyltransferase brn-like n=1 Tax=Mizuhopecten yessoensis TaxID=6573 RepID=UPI000B458876|nr:beta-1,3-galactosyltransferase brn-like [Mizuhopecten yessoensis]
MFYLNIGPSVQPNGCIAAEALSGFNSTLYSLENPRWRSELQIEQQVKVAIPFYNNPNYTSYPLNIDMRKFVRNHREGSQYTTPKMINVYPYMFITKPEVTCTNSTKLLFVIKSAPKNKRARQAIRDTWANEESVFGIKRVFVLGRTKVYHNDVEQEIKTHKDILLIDYEDSYYMNTWKLRGALIWAGNSCTECDYVMLVDDDYYVATDLLLQQLEMTGNSNESLYMGWEREYPGPSERNYLVANHRISPVPLHHEDHLVPSDFR